MKLISRIIAGLLFIVFFGFALKNTQEVALEFFLGHEIRAPLVLMLLVFFVSGVIFGVLAMMSTVLRQRRDLNRQRKIIVGMEKEGAARERLRSQPPQPDGVLDR
ncbi:MAG: LapA family protein [Glaciimonas sp.]|nr:LapA family protein [Glaciimonas sp.]